jgi:hypothetical protein
MSIHRSIPRSIVALFLATGALALTGTPASASVEHEFLFSFGPGGPGSGTFTELGGRTDGGIAVDQSTGNVYVVSGGSLYKFNSAGEPQEFSALKADTITGVEGGGIDEVAVDSSQGPAKGDIYIASDPFDGPEAHVSVYGADGSFLGELTGPGVPAGGEELVWREVTSVAVDSAGNVYVALTPFSRGAVNKYSPSGNPVKNTDYTTTLRVADQDGSCGITRSAVDGEGDVYATAGGCGSLLRKFSSSQFGQKEPQNGTVLYEKTPVRSLAVDPVNGDLYTGAAGLVSQFDSSDNLLGMFGSVGPGAVGNEFGIAVNGLSKEVYVSSADAGLVDVFSLPPVFTASTNAASGVTVHTGELEGAVNPAGVLVKACGFEYGPTLSYGSLASCSALPGSGKRFVKVTGEASGLSPYTVYHYRSVAVEGHTTVRGEDKMFTTGKAPPTVNDRAAFASNLSPLGVTLNGTVDPGNIPTGYHFVYGTTTAYGSVAPAPDGLVPVNNADDAVTQVLFGLQPNTVYHFALVASSPMGTVTGPDETFTTPPVPLPVVGAGGASGVSVNGATLSGFVDPQGWETSYFFEYGSSVAYGARWPGIPVTLGGLTGAQPVVAFVQNLQPGTVYHYRLVASNPGGVSYGADQTFTTPEYPVSVIAQAPLSGPLGIALPASKPTPKKAKHKKLRPKKRKRGRK